MSNSGRVLFCIVVSSYFWLRARKRNISHRHSLACKAANGLPKKFLLKPSVPNSFTKLEMFLWNNYFCTKYITIENLYIFVTNGTIKYW